MTDADKLAALLAVCQSFGIEETPGRVWLTIEGARIVGVEAGSAAAAAFIDLEARRDAAIALMAGD